MSCLSFLTSISLNLIIKSILLGQDEENNKKWKMEEDDTIDLYLFTLNPRPRLVLTLSVRFSLLQPPLTQSVYNNNHFNLSFKTT